jgi:ABC-type uncharacterized transport system involved in gliding motility auxiliary subunit
MNRFWTALVGTLGALALVFAINISAERWLAGAQLDLTEGRVFTLSPGTRQILAGLKDQVNLRLYYSPALGTRLPQYGAYADRVREILRQYVDLAGGRLRLELREPEAFSDSEDQALAEGLQAVPLDQGGDQVFFGLAGSNLLDDQQSIAFFQPEREAFLEYDLTRLVQSLASPKRAVLGLLSPLPMQGDPRGMMQRDPNAAPWAVMEGLRQSFTVKTVALDAKAIDPEIEVLLIAHPQNLSQATLYAIDQFVMRGGRVMALVAPHSDALPPDPTTGAPPLHTESNLAPLLTSWGVAYDPDKALGDLSGAWQVRAGTASRPQAVNYVAYFSVRDGINHEDPATAELSEVTIANAGEISKAGGSDVTFTPLLTSSRRAQVIPAADIRLYPNPAKILAGFKPDGQPHVIAARIRGELASAFPTPPEGSTGPHLAKTSGPANLVVIADADLLVDRFWTRQGNFFGEQQSTPFADNGAFIANLAGTLAGGDALIGLRARGVTRRPFALVDAMQRDAELRYRQTEQALTTHLEETTKKLADLRGGRDGSQTAALSAAQQKAMDELKSDLLDTRSRLRAVQLELRRDIQALETNLRMIDIALIPAVLLVCAIGLGLWRQARRGRARA